MLKFSVKVIWGQFKNVQGKNINLYYRKLFRIKINLSTKSLNKKKCNLITTRENELITYAGNNTNLDFNLRIRN